MNTIQAPSGANESCKCDTPSGCAPGWFCTVPTPDCPSVCFQGDECLTGTCDSENFSGTVTYNGTYIRNGSSAAWSNPTTSGVYNYVFNSSGATNSFSQGSVTLTLTYNGGTPYPPCLTVTIFSFATGSSYANNGQGGVGTGTISATVIYQLPVDESTGTVVLTVSLSAQSSLFGASVGFGWILGP